jgi:predicted MPP superfamily phosphohydrolase
VRLRVREVPVPGLPADLDGLRIAHLSDFHLGFPSRGRHAVERAIEWVAARRPDLVAITGDLVARNRGDRSLRELLDRLPRPVFAVLGNHDLGRAYSRDPFSRRAVIGDIGDAVLLRDESRVIDVRGRRVQVVGIDPVAFRRRRSHPEQLVDADADLRILLSHFPRVVDALPPGAFQLVLAGHIHAGQIVVPYPGGRLLLKEMRQPYVEGLYLRPGGALHVSPGLGTTFVPFRFFARPEATELVLQSMP